MPHAPRKPTLTDRQLEVLRLVAAGHTNKHIARLLGISRQTAEKHLTGVYRRLGVECRVAAVVRAEELGLLRAHLRRNTDRRGFALRRML